MKISIESSKYLTIFILEILAFISISFMEVFIEGPNGGLFTRMGINIFGFKSSIWLTITFPLLLLIPIVVKWFDSKLIGVLGIGYLIGTVLEDFLWFVINPNFGIQKFNQQFVSWLYWIKVSSLEIPLFYIENILLAFMVWFIFIKNSDRLNSFYRNLRKK